MLFLQYVFTFPAWEMAMMTYLQKGILKVQTSVDVLIYTYNYSFLCIYLNSISWPGSFLSVLIIWCVQKRQAFGGRPLDKWKLSPRSTMYVLPNSKGHAKQPFPTCFLAQSFLAHLIAKTLNLVLKGLLHQIRSAWNWYSWTGLVVCEDQGW